MDGRAPSMAMEFASLYRLNGELQSSCATTQQPAVDISWPNYSQALLKGDEDGSSSTDQAKAPKRVRISDENDLSVLPLPSPSTAGSSKVSAEGELDPPEMSTNEMEEDHECLVVKDVGTDPLEVLERPVFEHILSCLDARSLGMCLTVSTGWNQCAQANSLWDEACQQMWLGKLHIPSSALDPATQRLQAFQLSMADAKRVRIKPRDLCAWVWELHFKEQAGDYWRQLDPYYHGRPLMRRIFHEDGHITAEPMDQIWGGHECSWTFRKPKARGGQRMVRINHWPQLVVSRTPNWGWKMENAWVVYTSTNIPRYS